MISLEVIFSLNPYNMKGSGFKISSDQTVIFRYVFPYIAILIFGLMIYWTMQAGVYILVPVPILMFLVAFFIGRFYLFFLINDVYINYDTKSFEVEYLKSKESFLFTDLADIREGMYFIRLNFSNKKIYYMRQLFSPVSMFNEERFSITDLYAILEANKREDEAPNEQTIFF